MRFLSLIAAFAMMSLSLAAPVPVPQPQDGNIGADGLGCGPFGCDDI